MASSTSDKPRSPFLKVAVLAVLAVTVIGLQQAYTRYQQSHSLENQLQRHLPSMNKHLPMDVTDKLRQEPYRAEGKMLQGFFTFQEPLTDNAFREPDYSETTQAMREALLRGECRNEETRMLFTEGLVTRYQIHGQKGREYLTVIIDEATCREWLKNNPDLDAAPANATASPDPKEPA